MATDRLTKFCTSFEVVIILVIPKLFLMTAIVFSASYFAGLLSIKSNQIKSNQIKSNQTKSTQSNSNQFKANQIKSNRIKSNHMMT